MNSLFLAYAKRGGNIMQIFSVKRFLGVVRYIMLFVFEVRKEALQFCVSKKFVCIREHLILLHNFALSGASMFCVHLPDTEKKD